MYRLTKYTKNNLCIKLVFLYTIMKLSSGTYVSLGNVVADFSDKSHLAVTTLFIQ